jgi:hypothetical protein
MTRYKGNWSSIVTTCRPYVNKEKKRKDLFLIHSLISSFLVPFFGSSRFSSDRKLLLNWLDSSSSSFFSPILLYLFSNSNKPYCAQKHLTSASHDARNREGERQKRKIEVRDWTSGTACKRNAVQDNITHWTLIEKEN